MRLVSEEYQEQIESKAVGIIKDVLNFKENTMNVVEIITKKILNFCKNVLESMIE